MKDNRSYDFVRQKSNIKIQNSNFQKLRNTNQMQKESAELTDSVQRNQYRSTEAGLINNKKRNKMIEQMKMSKLFTQDRKRNAKQH